MRVKLTKPHVVSQETADLYAIFRVELDRDADTLRLYKRFGKEDDPERQRQVYHECPLSELKAPGFMQEVYALAQAKGWIPPGAVT